MFNQIEDDEAEDFLTREFNFNQSMFDLQETPIPRCPGGLNSPIQTVLNDFRDYANLMKIGHINARSVTKHRDEIERLLYEGFFDILGMSETFIKPRTPSCLYRVNNYKLFRKDRVAKNGGGVGIYVHKNYKSSVIKLPGEFSQPEVIFVEIQVKNTRIAVGTVYKAPNIPYGTLAQLHETLAYITTKYDHTIMLGDFNVNYNNPNSHDVNFMQVNVAEPFGLTQIIQTPTRVTETSSTLIDLALVSHVNNVKTLGVVDIPGISDHRLIYFAYSVAKIKSKPKTVTKRDFRKFSEADYIKDMSEAPWENVLSVDDNDIDGQVCILENIFSQYNNKHAPFNTFKEKEPKPWLTPDIKDMMDERDRYFLRKTLDSRDTEAEISFRQLRNVINRKIRQHKEGSFDDEVNSKLKDAKQYHNALKRHNVISSKFINTECNYDADELNETFTANNNLPVDNEKITREIKSILRNPLPPAFKLMPVTETDILKIVKSLKSNASGIDDNCAYFIKLSIDSSVGAITHIINSSFRHRFFPSRWKKALIKPLPKVENPSSASEYRPISLLPTLSKIIEKVVFQQISKYLRAHNLCDVLQSAYTRLHSTETALLNITEDIFEAMDKSEVTFLILLDYSKAFDVANHRLILAKLKALGFHDDSLSWVTSYLTDRAQKVKTETGESRYISISNGVPQGSVLGPLLFAVLVSDISKVIDHGKYHMYADDTQLYYHCKISEINDQIEKINLDLKAVASFSDKNCLKLSSKKDCNNFIIIASKPNLKKIENLALADIFINDIKVERRFKVKNLGVFFDENLSWTTHVNYLIGRAYGKLRQIYRFKNFLSLDSKTNICECYVLSHFNYCNTIYQNMSEFLKHKIQKVQNTCLRFIHNARKFDHLSPLFNKQNTLDMEERRNLHGIMLMNKIVLKLAPSYLCDRVKHNADIHQHNTRQRQNISHTRVNTTKAQQAFIYKFSRIYNEMSKTVKNNVSLHTYRQRVIKYIKERRNL